MKTCLIYLLKFLSKLGLTRVSDKNTETQDPYLRIHRPTLKPYDKDKFENVIDYTYKDVTVPAGYKTNGANIPRALWSLDTREGYLKADHYLKEMMTFLGCSKFKVNCFYYSVKIYHKVRYGV